TYPVNAFVHRVFDFHGRPPFLKLAYQPRFSRPVDYTTDRSSAMGRSRSSSRDTIDVADALPYPPHPVRLEDRVNRLPRRPWDAVLTSQGDHLAGEPLPFEAVFPVHA